MCNPSTEYKLELLLQVEQFYFAVHSNDINEDERTFVIKGVDIILPKGG